MNKFMPLIDYVNKKFTGDSKLELLDEFGDTITTVIKYKGKVFLGTTKPVGTCADCGGPVYLDNKTSFKYHCPFENINVYENKLIKSKR